MRVKWFANRREVKTQLQYMSDEDLVRELHELDDQKQLTRARMKAINAEQTRRFNENPPDRGQEIHI